MFPEDIADIIHFNFAFSSYHHILHTFTFFCIGPHNSNRLIPTFSDLGHHEVVLHLIQDPLVFPRSCENEHILVACLKNHLSVAQLLLPTQTIVPHGTPLMHASHFCHKDVVRLLLTYDEVNVRGLAIENALVSQEFDRLQTLLNHVN